MGWLDWIPTVPEIINFIDCRVTGHDYEDGKCTNCGQEE